MDLYYLPESAPCSAVRLTAAALGIELNLKHTDLETGEHLKPEFIKLNPQHTIPTLVDAGFPLWESRAIMIYLVDKYGNNDSLYPADPQKRALVNQRLCFDLGVLYQRFADFWYPQIFEKKPAIPENRKKMDEAVEFLEKFLEGRLYAAGDGLTIADFSLIASAATYEIAGFDFSKYSNVRAWMERCRKNIVGYELNQSCAELFKKAFLTEFL